MCLHVPGCCCVCCAQTVVIYAATKGYMDKVAVQDITKAEQVVLQHTNPDIYKVWACERMLGAGAHG